MKTHDERIASRELAKVELPKQKDGLEVITRYSASIASRTFQNGPKLTVATLDAFQDGAGIGHRQPTNPIRKPLSLTQQADVSIVRPSPYRRADEKNLLLNPSTGLIRPLSSVTFVYYAFNVKYLRTNFVLS